MHTATPPRVPPLAKATGKNETPDFGIQCTPEKQKTAGAFLPAVVRWARPTSYLRAHLCPPLFHLYALAPLYLRLESGRSRKIPLLDLSRT